jgi:hypothetical protein
VPLCKAGALEIVDEGARQLRASHTLLLTTADSAPDDASLRRVVRGTFTGVLVGDTVPP